MIPREATFELQDKIFVYVVEDGVTRSKQVIVSSFDDGTRYVVESGLNEGDVIIAEGAGLMRAGMAVNVEK